MAGKDKVLLILFFLLFILGCNTSDETTDEDNQNDETIQNADAYIIPTNDLSVQLAPESDPCYVIPSMARSIYAYGKRPDSSYKTVVLYKDPTTTKQYVSEASIKIGPNSYLANGKFTVQLILYEPGNYRLEMRGSGTTYYDDFEATSKTVRDYKIEYLCQSGYDIRAEGTQTQQNNMLQKLKKVYELAGTTMQERDGSVLSNLQPYRSDLTAETINIITDNVTDELFVYASQYISGEWSHDNKVGVLFGVKNYTSKKLNGDDDDPNASGMSLFRTSTAWGYSFVFVDRIWAVHSGDGDGGVSRRKDFDAVLIHELGHQRGILNDAHNLNEGNNRYHNGSWKKYCVMVDPRNLPNNTSKQKYYDDPQFCEYHEQFLLQIFWE